MSFFWLHLHINLNQKCYKLSLFRFAYKVKSFTFPLESVATSFVCHPIKLHLSEASLRLLVFRTLSPSLLNTSNDTGAFLIGSNLLFVFILVYQLTSEMLQRCNKGRCVTFLFAVDIRIYKGRGQKKALHFCKAFPFMCNQKRESLNFAALLLSSA